MREDELINYPVSATYGNSNKECVEVASKGEKSDACEERMGE